MRPGAVTTLSSEVTAAGGEVRLEGATTVATIVWKGGRSGAPNSWKTQQNWKGGGVPAAGDDVIIANVTNKPVLNVNTANLKSLTIKTNASLTVGNFTLNVTGTAASAITLAGAGSAITVAGGTINDSGGVSLAAGSVLSGSGTLAIAGTYSGTGTLTATGGTLAISGTIASGVVMTIGSASASNLTILGTATSAAAIAIDNANQTLQIGAGGNLTIGVTESITNGTISMAGGTLSDAAGLTLGTGSTLTGFGTVNPAFVGSNAGVVTASGGALILKSNVPAASGLIFDVFDSAASILRFDGSVGATNTVSFLGTHGAAELNDVSIGANGLHYAGTISGLSVAAGATPTFGTINYINVQATITSVVFNDSTHIELFSNTTDLGTIALGNAVNLGTTHVDWGADLSFTGHTIGSGSDIFLSSVVCFAAGTRILTPTGERMVESLQEGDIVFTLSGEQLIAQPVKWIGHRRIDLTAHPRPETAAPVLIQRGAFADNMPHTDLLVSPDHAIFVDGKLICARQLINGTTIRQKMESKSVAYFHVELDTHAILLSEGLPTESYLSTGNRRFFANSGEPMLLHPDMTDETDYPTREAGSCAPFVSSEGNVRPVWERLVKRAAMLGQPMAPLAETTTDPGLRLVADGRTIRPLHTENGLSLYALPKGTTEVRLVSRSGSPTDVRPWLEDRRRLGVYVERIVVRGSHEMREIPVDHPSLSKGWLEVERTGTVLRRWTDGDAPLPLPTLDGPVLLEIRAGNGGMSYIADRELERRIA
jgi:hypothetical protein